MPEPVRPPAGLHHLAVLCDDLDRAERFYLGVLGLGLRVRHHLPDGAHRSTWVELGDGAFLALERASPGASPRDDQGVGWHCVALRIPRADRDLWRARLEVAGHPVERSTAYTLYARDPDGNLVALSHHPDADTM